MAEIITQLLIDESMRGPDGLQLLVERAANQFAEPWFGAAVA